MKTPHLGIDDFNQSPNEVGKAPCRAAIEKFPYAALNLSRLRAKAVRETVQPRERVGARPR
jgi:hypothetical protein